jgi:peptide/nickel transport system substrate-binding protein
MKEIWHTEAIENGLNIVSYSNPKVDVLIDKAREVENYQDAKKYMDEMQVLVQEDQPFTFLYENDRLNGLNRRIQNAKMNVLSSFFNLEEWKVGE